MSSVKSPRRKKKHALDWDHVTPAEYPHAFRKLWPRKKAHTTRAHRRKVRQLLGAGEDSAVGAVRREEVRKWEVITVRERIQYKQEKRQALAGHKARRGVNKTE